MSDIRESPRGEQTGWRTQNYVRFVVQSAFESPSVDPMTPDFEKA